MPMSKEESVYHSWHFQRRYTISFSAVVSGREYSVFHIAELRGLWYLQTERDPLRLLNPIITII